MARLTGGNGRKAPTRQSSAKTGSKPNAPRQVARPSPKPSIGKGGATPPPRSSGSGYMAANSDIFTPDGLKRPGLSTQAVNVTKLKDNGHRLVVQPGANPNSLPTAANMVGDHGPITPTIAPGVGIVYSVPDASQLSPTVQQQLAAQMGLDTTDIRLNNALGGLPLATHNAVMNVVDAVTKPKPMTASEFLHSQTGVGGTKGTPRPVDRSLAAKKGWETRRKNGK